MNTKKYCPQYYRAKENCFDFIKKDYPKQAPIWCSVDLRDGNQALINPMDIDKKIEYFKMLVKLGLKFIEVSFPSASNTEFLFTRRLIEENLIPDDVTIQVLTQARKNIIEKTFEAIQGAKNVIVHLYNSTSKTQREQVFCKSKEDIIKLAVDGAKLLKQFACEHQGNIRFEYSPESYSGTEIDFALDICNAVINEINPTNTNKMIINLPSTIENSLPHIFASNIEFMNKNLAKRDCIELSVHPHNDRGCAVATAEMSLLAGADRIEGTLFGNGERTGNVDLVTLGLNMLALGVEPNLDFSNLMQIKETYEKLTEMQVPLRQPYAGDLVFTAFSGSHQDAISKGLQFRKNNNQTTWNVPYLPIDPKDIGRVYEGNIIRINSQSGKGGINYIIKQFTDNDIPLEIREKFSYHIKGISDNLKRELTSQEIYFEYQNYVKIEK